MNLLSFINSSRLFNWLVFLNIAIGCVVFYVFRNSISGDHYTYLGLADGIKHGIYSYWYFLDSYTPDTFRTPGYPLFIFIFRLFTENIFLVKVSQLILYFLAVGLILRCIQLYNKQYALRNIFLLLLLPNIQIVHYTGYIFPEILMVFLLCFFVYINVLLKESYFKAIILGVVFGLAFQVRPIFLFFPICFIIINVVVIRKKEHLKYSFLTLLVYGLTLLPYATWNYVNHGIFKVTPLEGGGGIIHLGFWQHKLPNYYDERYWTTYYGSEIVRFIDEDQHQEYIGEYNKEWDYIDSVCKPYLTKKDVACLQLMEKNKELFKTYSTNFTLKREEVLKELTIKHIKEEPLYYLKVKIYSAIRLFITGVNLDSFRTQSNFIKKIGLLIPTLITGTLFLFSIIFIPWVFINRKINISPITPALCLVLYYWLIHIPMAIQSRYTIPIQLILIYILAIAIFELFKSKRLIILK